MPPLTASVAPFLIGLTDAEGDFLNYTIDVLGLTLETANGRTVEVMPRTTRVNFTDYVDVTELVAAAVVPPATYVSGTISLDYSDAEVLVEAAGVAKAAVVTDTDDVELGQDTAQNRIIQPRSAGRQQAPCAPPAIGL